MPKWSPIGIIILAKYQLDNSHSLWAMVIWMFSPFAIIQNQSLLPSSKLCKCILAQSKIYFSRIFFKMDFFLTWAESSTMRASEQFEIQKVLFTIPNIPLLLHSFYPIKYICILYKIIKLNKIQVIIMCGNIFQSSSFNSQLLNFNLKFEKFCLTFHFCEAFLYVLPTIDDILSTLN